MTNNLDVKFYDTCSLLLGGEKILPSGEHFVISSITLKELEKIKTSAYKDEDTKYNARILLHLLEAYRENYDVIIHTINNEDTIKEASLDITDDTRILSDAIFANDSDLYRDRVIFVTNDLSLKNIANLFFGDKMIESIKEEIDDYTGYLEVVMDDETMAHFYQDTTINEFGLKIGEYLIIRDSSFDKNIVDMRVWTGNDHRYLKYGDFDSKWFGKIKPYKDDPYQKMVFDSLSNNQITMLKGPAGSGKTFIALGYLMNRLEKNAIDKIIVFCNTVATANSAKLGFYPGTKDEKLLDSQIGNLLSCKFGGREGIEALIQQGKLVLLPMSDLRGYDTSGMNAGIYISEAQNLDKNLIKLALQRIGEDCICIIDGDPQTQTDLEIYKKQNGMKRVSKIFRGQSYYGEVELKTIHRSQIARQAEYI